ncbi:c-type cytochrome biogenesis protein CcmI [Tropicimonas sediminicola]|uniref:Cytochrome c-type biogenesis protein CcmH n=1 Tax=Tropicimonas sediminicola TaxID=1031541 RepID=A0A239D9Z2_9RHOB|nr:c-type cytochrome biogenesis protein CcmI [Tropicimonas sediminicola]SNS28483.1 cytochrome c-type biogenesis protein CcmH [Tropicimonas sediminicola]
MTFWIISALVALIAALLIGWPMLRPSEPGDAEPQDKDIGIYRDQLRSVEKDLARGVVTEEEAERLRTEIKRRILDADRAGSEQATHAPRGASYATAAVAGLVVIGGTFYLYDRIGAPGYEDLPLSKRLSMAEEQRQNRPSQAEFEAAMPATPPVAVGDEYAELIQKLRDAVSETPEDVEGWALLARSEANIGNIPAAHAAQRKLLDLKGDMATAQDYLTYAGLLIQAAGGNVSADADWALGNALQRDPHEPVARYYVGLMHLQTGRPDEAFQYWEPLLRQSRPSDPWVPVIRSRLESVAAMAGIKYSLPAPAPLPGGAGGPSAEDMAAAAEMSPEERQAFIQNMVDQLGARLAEEGGPPSDWARLIRAHGVMGNVEQATAIWTEAQQAFADPAALAPIRQAALDAGVEIEERGPSQEDIDAAAEMEPEDRQAMVQAMVDQLGERLATEGGPASDWAQLVRAHGVLGNTDRAAAIWGEAQQVFAERPEELELIRQAAVDAGVAE